MALGKGFFINQYKNKSTEELKEQLDYLKKYFFSDEIKKEEEEYQKNVDDNSIIFNTKNEIMAIEEILSQRQINIEPTFK